MQFSTILHIDNRLCRVEPGATFELRSGKSDGRSWIVPQSKERGIQVSNELLASNDVVIRDHGSPDRSPHTRSELMILKASLCCQAADPLGRALLVPEVARSDEHPKWVHTSHCVWIPELDVELRSWKNQGLHGTILMPGLAVLAQGDRISVRVAKDSGRSARSERQSVFQYDVMFDRGELKLIGAPIPACPDANYHVVDESPELRYI
jgi:hypothetical protein